jgi:hypothetical protein
VPRVRIREEIRLVSKPTPENYEEIREFEVPVPVGERIVERPNVVVDEKIIYTTGRDMIVDTTEEIIEVPHMVQVPRIVAVPKIERRTEVKEFSVPNIQQNVNVIVVDQEQTVLKCVDVPEVHTTRNIRYIPKFTCPEQDVTRVITTDVVFELKEVQAFIAKIEREKGDLRTRLAQSLIDLSAKRQQVDTERMTNFTLEEKIKSALIMSGGGGDIGGGGGVRAFSPKLPYAPVSSVLVSGADRNYDGIPDVLQGGRAFSPKSTYAPVSSVVVSGADRNYDGIPDALQGGRAVYQARAPVSSVVVSGVDRNYDGIPDALQGGRAVY